MGTTAEFSWRPQMRGFVRKGLKAGACDVYMGVPANYGPLLTTTPYYRSTYVFVYRANGPVHVRSLDDRALRSLRVGVHMIGDDYQNTPPAQALAARGMIDNVRGYPIVGDYSKPNPQARILEALARGEIDVAIVWGPFAGYFAKQLDTAHHRAGHARTTTRRARSSLSTLRWGCATPTPRSPARSTRCSCASGRPFERSYPTMAYRSPPARRMTVRPTETDYANEAACHFHWRRLVHSCCSPRATRVRSPPPAPRTRPPPLPTRADRRPRRSRCTTSGGDEKLALEGRQLFLSHNCYGCHGGLAGGAMGPSLRDTTWKYGGSDSLIYRTIHDGRPMGMPAWGGAFSDAQIKALVSYIHSLRTKAEPQFFFAAAGDSTANTAAPPPPANP